MSNADDICRWCETSRAVHPFRQSTHAFVEPQPAPSGDEAKVREIALRWSEKFDLSSGARMVGAVREAYAAGKADALKVLDERIANMRGGPRLAEAREIRDAIARRGSEGA